MTPDRGSDSAFQAAACCEPRGRRLRRASRAGLCLAALGLVLHGAACTREDLPAGTLRAGLFSSETYNGRAYRLYVPAGYAAGRPAPLVVMLHGCTQDPDQFATGTQMNALAEAKGFLVAYPAQPSSANIQKCWNWFDPAHQARGAGEPSQIAGIVAHIAATYTIDRSRVYAAGLSAGAAEAVILGATYPDVFAAIAVGAGLEYKAATSSLAGLTAMRSGGPDPAAQGRAAYAAMGAARRPVPVIVFHGSADTTVAPLNGDQVVAQWAKTLDLATDGAEDGNVPTAPASTATATVPGGRRYTRGVYKDTRTGAVLIEKITVEGMNHAWSGGSAAGSYTDPKGPDASALAWEFFAAHPAGGTAPVDGGTAPDLFTPDLRAPVDLARPADLARPTDLATPTDLSTASDLSTPDAGAQDAGSAPDLSSGPHVTLLSIDAEDGYAGAVVADGVSAGHVQAGDKGMYNGDTYRGILSFDARALPAGPPKSASLVLTRKALSGSVSAVLLDVKTGVLGRSAALAQEDYAAAATVTGITTFVPPTSDLGTVTIPLPPAALSALIRGERIQIRLRAVTAINFTADRIDFYDGADARYAPVLALGY